MVLASQFIGSDILLANSKQLITTILRAPNGVRVVLVQALECKYITI